MKIFFRFLLSFPQIFLGSKVRGGGFGKVESESTRCIPTTGYRQNRGRSTEYTSSHLISFQEQGFLF